MRVWISYPCSSRAHWEVNKFPANLAIPLNHMGCGSCVRLRAAGIRTLLTLDQILTEPSDRRLGGLRKERFSVVDCRVGARQQ